MDSEKTGFEARRERLVGCMAGSCTIKSAEVRKAFLKVKRELFVPEEYVEYAYADDAMPIGFGQTISQPSTIAVMLELLQAGKGMNVLEVGSGCGYVLALLSEIVGGNGKVFGIELVRELVAAACKNLEKEGCRNAEVVFGDGSKGWSEKAPFDRILVSAACPYIPRPLFDQLREGGRAVAPVGDRYTQVMETIVKRQGKAVKLQGFEGFFAFVPLRGELGWK